MKIYPLYISGCFECPCKEDCEQCKDINQIGFPNDCELNDE